jgi:hypothetical protein
LIAPTDKDWPIFEIHDAIPNHEALLALAPEEMAGKLLFLMRERDQGDKNLLQTSDFITEVMIEKLPLEGGKGYPHGARVSAAFALTEAIMWLQAHGLLIPPFRAVSRSRGTARNTHMND